MKSIKLSFIGLFGALLLASCGGNWDFNVNKTADALCRVKLLKQKAINGDQSAQEALKEAQAKADKLQQDFKIRYADKEYTKFKKNVRQKLKECGKQ